MARSDWNGFWKRLLGLVVLLGVLCGALAWQWRGFDWKSLPSKQNLAELQARKLLPSPLAVELDKLNEKWLQKVRAKDAEIAALRRARANAGSYPVLAVPVVFAASTRRKFRDDQLRFRLRELSDYQKLTADPPEARAASEQFLEAYLHQMVERDVHSPDFRRLDELGRGALDAGSRDPMLGIYHAHARWMASADSSSVIRTWTEMLTELPRTKYPRMVEVYARYFLRDVARSRPLDNDIADFRILPVPQIVQSLEEEGTGLLINGSSSGGAPVLRRTTCSTRGSCSPNCPTHLVP